MKALHLTLALLGFALGPLGLAAQAPASPASPTVVLLVRHAETQPDGTTDPPLSEVGRARVEGWVSALASVPLAAVHSSPYRRTRGTAGPVATAHQLAVQEYDPDQLPAFAALLRAAGGTHLVVGHSNTTPALARALGGEPGSPIAETEHGRLYVLTIEAGGVRTLLLRLPAP